VNPLKTWDIGLIVISTTPYADLTSLAERTGLPESWLRREAAEKRIPSFKIGRRLMFNVGAVLFALSQRDEMQVIGLEGIADA
jgi:hypothetical protein